MDHFSCLLFNEPAALLSPSTGSLLDESVLDLCVLETARPRSALLRIIPLLQLGRGEMRHEALLKLRFAIVRGGFDGLNCEVDERGGAVQLLLPVLDEVLSDLLVDEAFNDLQLVRVARLYQVVLQHLRFGLLAWELRYHHWRARV